MKKTSLIAGVVLLLSLTSCQEVTERQVVRRIIGVNIPVKNMSVDTLPGKTERGVDFIVPEDLFE